MLCETVQILVHSNIVQCIIIRKIHSNRLPISITKYMKSIFLCNKHDTGIFTSHQGCNFGMKVGGDIKVEADGPTVKPFIRFFNLFTNEPKHIFFWMLAFLLLRTQKCQNTLLFIFIDRYILVHYYKGLKNINIWKNEV